MGHSTCEASSIEIGFGTNKEKLLAYEQPVFPVQSSEKCTPEQFNLQSDEFYLLPEFFWSAYIQNYSTETSLLKMVNDFLWGMERKQVTAVAILDMYTAFDTVDH